MNVKVGPRTFRNQNKTCAKTHMAVYISFCMFCALILYWPRFQVSVYRTIGPLVFLQGSNKYLKSILKEKREKNNV